MTSEESVDLKEVIFVNQAARRDYDGMPPHVRESADESITQLQNERPLPPKMFKRLKGNLSGIDEIVLPYDDDTYRVYIALRSAAVYILDAGIKKSKSGDDIPPNQKERLIERCRKAAKDYDANKAKLENEAAARRVRHDYLVKIGELP